MTATTLVESLSRLYEHGRLTKAGIAARVKKGTITEDDYKTITGEDYSGGLELIDFLADAVATLLRIAKAQNEQLQQLGAVAAEEESLHDIECACSAVLPSPARGEVEEDVH